METVKKRRSWLKTLCLVLGVIIFIVAAAGVAFACVWRNEITTVENFKHLRARDDAHEDGSVYSMKVKGGYYFDDFLKHGAKTDSELSAFIMNKITRGLMKMEIKETDIGCSSFTATAENGDKLFARNYDFDKTNVCITLCNPGGGRYKSFSSVDLNYLGMDIDKDVSGLMNKITCLAAPYVPLDGINEAGVACGIYMSYQGESTVATDQNLSDKKNITSTTMLRLVLDYAGSVDEAVELIKNYNLHDSANTSFHYMVADSTGKSAVLEWLPDNAADDTDNDGSARKLVVHYNTGDGYLGEREGAADYQWVTNFILQTGYYDCYEGLELINEKNGADRYDHIYERLSPTNGVVKDEAAAMEILKEIGRRTWNGGGGVTVHSVVYNLTKKTVLWVANENFGDGTATYTYSFADGKLKQG